MKKRSAWYRRALKFSDVRVQLKPEAIQALEYLAGRIQTDPKGRLSSSFDQAKFPSLARQVSESILTYVEEGPGMVIFDGIGESGIAKDQWKTAYRILTEFCGDVIQQDGHILEMKEVTDRGLTLDQGGARYSDTRYGGGHHTDGAERPMTLVPDYFGLICINGAAEGGALQVMSALSVHEQLAATDPDALKTLYEPFHFDLRGDLMDGKKTAEKPIFFEKDGNVGITYLGEYVRSGHAYQHVPDLTKKQEAALRALERVFEDEGLIVEGYVEPGETILVNNLSVLHGRTSFRDDPDPSKRRSLYRTWIRKRHR